MEEVFIACRISPTSDQWVVRPAPGRCVGNLLEHGPLTEYEAAFLAAHVNHAFAQGVRAGNAQRLAVIRDALNL